MAFLFISTIVGWPGDAVAVSYRLVQSPSRFESSAGYVPMVLVVIAKAGFPSMKCEWGRLRVDSVKYLFCFRTGCNWFFVNIRSALISGQYYFIYYKSNNFVPKLFKIRPSF